MPVILQLIVFVALGLVPIPKVAASDVYSVDQAESKALKIVGVDIVSMRGADLIETTVVPIDSAGRMPQAVKDSFTGDSLWRVTVKNVTMDGKYYYSDAENRHTKTITIYLGRNSGRFMKAEICSAEGCAAPVDAWDWPSPPYVFLEENLRSAVKPIDPSPDQSILSLLNDHKSDNPLVPCKIEVYSLSYLWKNTTRRTSIQPPDSLPVWAAVYKYYFPADETSGDSVSETGSGPNVHLVFWAICPHSDWSGLHLSITPPWLPKP